MWQNTVKFFVAAWEHLMDLNQKSEIKKKNLEIR